MLGMTSACAGPRLGPSHPGKGAHIQRQLALWPPRRHSCAADAPFAVLWLQGLGMRAWGAGVARRSSRRWATAMR